MRAIMIMFDTLSKRFLPNYGCDWTQMPNFKRLGEKTVTFDNFYVGSLPCMPARRELHTGRLNFLHRGWSPLEPFDDSMPEILKNSGVYTHLVTDHQHYWEDGGATYHNRYNSYEFIRGQEGDAWKGVVNDPKGLPESISKMPGFFKKLRRQDFINRKYMEDEKDHPQARAFEKGLEFLSTNKDADNWFLQLEYFDPHEPFFVPERFKELYKDNFDEDFDWPSYGPSSDDSEEKIKHGRNMYAALMAMCDYYLGQVLDFMDENNMWEDTMLIVNTDHGFLLGEKEWWGKNIMPTYNELANTPFFMWDPRIEVKGERRDAIGQTIDIAPSLLEFFNQEIPKDMIGKPLKSIVKDDTKVRDYAMFGFHGGHINITDANHVYMRACNDFGNGPLYEYTLMPMDMNAMKKAKQLKKAKLVKPFNFTKEMPLLKIRPSMAMFNSYLSGHKLFDLKEDPNQEKQIVDFKVEKRFCDEIVKLMKENDAPKEQYKRVGLSTNKDITENQIANDMNKRAVAEEKLIKSLGIPVAEDAKDAFLSIAANVPKKFHIPFAMKFKKNLKSSNVTELTTDEILAFMETQVPPEFAAFAKIFMKSSVRRN